MKDQTSLVRKSLLANAVFSTACAVALLFNSQAIAKLIGLGVPEIYLGLGIGLTLFAAHLIYLATAKTVSTINALIASVSDAIWVIGSIIILAIYSDSLTITSVLIIEGVAICVAAFGVLQAIGIVRTFENTEKPGQYKICFRVETEAKYSDLWTIVSDLAGIKRYVDELATAEIVQGEAQSVGAIRRCQDTKGKQWREICKKRIEGEYLELQFLCDDEDFPFPMSEMLGHWTLKPNGLNKTTLDIAWEMKPKHAFFMFLFLPLMASKIASDFPKVIAKMESDAQRLSGGLPLEERAHGSSRQLISGFC